MHFNVCVFTELKEPFRPESTEFELDTIVCDQIGDYHTESDCGYDFYDWFEIGGRWNMTLPAKEGKCNYCMLEEFDPFPKLKKEDMAIWDRMYNLLILPKDQITEEKRIEAKDLGVVILSESCTPTRIPTFDEYVHNKTWYYPYSYVTHDGDWVDGDENPDITKLFETYVKGLKRLKKKEKYIGVINVDCHI